MFYSRCVHSGSKLLTVFPTLIWYLLVRIWHFLKAIVYGCQCAFNYWRSHGQYNAIRTPSTAELRLFHLCLQVNVVWCHHQSMRCVPLISYLDGGGLNLPGKLSAVLSQDESARLVFWAWDVVWGPVLTLWFSYLQRKHCPLGFWRSKNLTFSTNES